MLFSEVYGSYFQVVSAILTEAAEGAMTAGRLTALVQEKAFSESVLSIPAALQSGDWPLLNRELHSVLHHVPTMPLTTLEKRWLKALLADPRIALFQPEASGLTDVQPLFQPDTFVLFDRYADGDPYTDPHYIVCFQRVLQAIHEHRNIRIRFRSQSGASRVQTCTPYRLEYSAKDDKFRLLVTGVRRLTTINMARVCFCELLGASEPCLAPPREHLKELTLLLYDERNALERVLLHFSHFEKETQKLDDRHYQITLRYDREDETELLIRVLSFGPMLEVTAPEAFRQLMQERIQKQLALLQSRSSPAAR